MSENNILKCVIKPRVIIFPTTALGVSGGFCIFKAELIELTEGDMPETTKNGEFTLKGTVPDLDKSSTYNVIAKKVDDPKWGMQYNIIFINECAGLSNTTDQKKFLLHILNENVVDNLYAMYENPFDIIREEDTAKLMKVKGIKITTATKIIHRFKDTVDYSEAYVELDALGLTDLMIKKLCNTYGNPRLLINAFKENPYILCEDVEGIGFKRADEFAIRAGIANGSTVRIKGYINYILDEKAMMGNSWNETSFIISSCMTELGLERTHLNLIGSVMNGMDLWFSKDHKRIGLKRYYNLEHRIAEELIRIQYGGGIYDITGWEDTVKKIEGNIGFEYTDEQKAGVSKVLKNNLTVLTGLGGTGKTTITKAMIAVLGNKYTFAQTALAGRAAKRMSELTGYEASTIHRLLGYNPSGNKDANGKKTSPYEYNKDNPLPYDIIILDEASMIGGDLFYSLISAIKTGAKLLVIGDHGQLESIGACNVFHDLLNSEEIPVIKLTKIHRQAQKSAIITESIKVRNNEQIITKTFTGKQVLGELQDLELDISEENLSTLLRILDHYKKQLIEVGSDPMRIQVIVPQKERGDISTYRINNAIQAIHNGEGENAIELTLSKDKKYKLKEKDKVICTKNNYKTTNLKGEVVPIFNGSIGVIDKINIEEGAMVVNFTDIGRIYLTKDMWNSIQLGYAITVHKMQGSSCNTVVIGMDYSAYKMLTAEMLYTAISRAEKYCVLVGENLAVRHATKTTNISKKTTFLKELLVEIRDNVPF